MINYKGYLITKFVYLHLYHVIVNRKKKLFPFDLSTQKIIFLGYFPQYGLFFMFLFFPTGWLKWCRVAKMSGSESV